MPCAIIYSDKFSQYTTKNIIDKPIVDYIYSSLIHIGFKRIILACNYHINCNGSIEYLYTTNSLQILERIDDDYTLFVPLESLLFDSEPIRNIINDYLRYNVKIIRDKRRKLYLVDNSLLANKGSKISNYLNVIYKTIPRKLKREIKIHLAYLNDIIGLEDFIYMESNLKNEIALRHMSNGVYIDNPQATIIGIDVKICSGSIVTGGSKITGKTVIKSNTLIEDSSISNSIIGNNTKIFKSIIDDSKIGGMTTVGPYARIRNNSIIGNNIRIGNFVEIKNSIIDDYTKIAHLAYIGDSEIGKNVNFGCGAITVNYDGRNKNKTIIKDNSFIGCNSNLIAPITIAENTYIAAGSTITSSTSPNDFAISRPLETIKNNYSQKYIGENE